MPYQVISHHFPRNNGTQVFYSANYLNIYCQALK
ncbi:hypothetical protein J2T17_006061 [Paenibacillus mucilaginosus]